jgi:hypothetical protein
MKLHWVILLAAFSVTVVAGSGCQRAFTPEPSVEAPPPSAAQVIAENSGRLMALPNVVGVYEGSMADGKTHCIVVMLSQTNPQTLKQLPATLEGFPVRAEVSGEIKPVSK